MVLLHSILELSLNSWNLCGRWSLLEKHSCTASKLHLKPRRFKMFLEALVSFLLTYVIASYLLAFYYTCFAISSILFRPINVSFLPLKEHQLLKDRRRSKRKRPAQGEDCSLLSAATTFSLLSKSRGNDMQPTKLLFVDGQSMQKMLPAKGASSLKRGINISCTDRDMLNVKIVRQRRKAGNDLL